MSLKSKYESYRRKKILHYLRTSSPDKFEKMAKKKVIQAFSKACRSSPAYLNLISDSDLKPSDVSSLDQFSELVPITNKNNYFEQYSLAELAGRNKNDIKLAMTSSGFSGSFAYGFSKEKSLRKGRMGVDTTLDYWFDIENRTTFLINCAPMGVHVETSLPIAEVSVRSDMALALLKKVSPTYDQTILIGDPNFLKKLVEEGTYLKLDWNKLNVSLITAQDWLAESLRSYLAGMLQINLDKQGHRGIYATMGMTELGLNVFHESKYTVALRRAVMKDKALRDKLVKSPMNYSPCFFHYYPFRTYIETIEKNQLEEFLFTLLDQDAIVPIIRYQTGDKGELVTYEEINSVLANQYKNLLPDLKLPIGIMGGRINNALQHKGTFLFLEDIKEGLFSDSELANCITGLAGLKAINGVPQIQVHLKNGIKKNTSLNRKAEEAANIFLPIQTNVKLIEYYSLPDAVELNYEKKLFIR